MSVVFKYIAYLYCIIYAYDPIRHFDNFLLELLHSAVINGKMLHVIIIVCDDKNNNYVSRAN